MKTSHAIVALLLAALAHTSCTAPEPPAPYGPVPTADQLAWQRMEYYMFVHFGPNTFTDVEWGDGKEDPKVFNPTAVDCRQWAATAKAAGMAGIVLTVKHHDGFCLWPSKLSTHTVRESGWKDGKGDLLRELADACREYDLKLGVYLSPWDQNHPSYGTDEYNKVFAGMLDEVLGGYGSVFEQWFDGANGEGPDGKKQIYDWPMFHETVYRHQPNAVIFSDVGPGCRWMGNERGVAGETNWSTLNIAGFEPGLGAPPSRVLNTGEQGGEAWVPAETDVSIRPGWFYSPSTDSRVKSAEQLMEIYYTSVGRNSNLLLNVPPDRTGRINAADSTALMSFRQAREAAFANNLAAGALTLTNSLRGREFSAKNITDGDPDTYWAAKDEALSAELEIDLGAEQTFNRLLLSEHIPLGQRVSGVTVECRKENGEWEPVTEATTIGYKRILRFDEVTARHIRISLTALACPTLSNVAVYRAPEVSQM
ncbi:MAG: alpha-L-fucosidase [Alistipes sp.]|nr:alpha-L-fucosidase [Alistipes sp.]